MWDLIKTFFGISGRCQPSDLFYNQPSLDDNDTSLPATFGFSVFVNPVQMQKFLERQMDELLKNAFDFGNNTVFEEEYLHEGQIGSLRDEFLKSGDSPKMEVYSDLDEQICSSQIEKFLGSGSALQNKPKFFSQSVIIRTIRKPDGTMETVRTERNSDGQEQTIVTYGSVSPKPPHKLQS